MEKNKEYWARRFEALEDAQINKGASYYAELEKQYKKASKAIQSDIEKWYTRLATNNGISLQEARKLLTTNELEEFKWDVDEYIKKARTLNVSDAWAKQLENASARVHISRLEALKIQMQNHIEVLYANELDGLSKTAEKIYTDGYYHTAYEIQKGVGIGYSLMKLDKNKIQKVLLKPWAADGSNFSDRIWKHKAQLVSELHNNLTQAIIRGQDPYGVTEAIAKRFNVSKGQAGRLVMTEAAFFASASTRDCYKDLDVEKYEILATLDRKTSEICRALDGKVFNMSEYEIGVTAPPFHTRCRTTTVPYFDDEFELNSERAARGEDGKTYYVPDDMTYKDWYKTYVAVKMDIEGLNSKIQSSNIRISTLDNCISFEELKTYLKQEYNATIDADVFSLNFESVKQMTKEFEEVIKEFNWAKNSFTGLNTHNRGYAAFSPAGELCFNPKYSAIFDERTLTSGYHEAGHLLEIALIKRKYPNIDIDGVIDKYMSSEIAEEIVTKALSRIKSNKTAFELRKQISRQAIINYSESLADAIKDYKVNGSSSAILTRQIIRVLKEIE